MTTALPSTAPCPCGRGRFALCCAPLLSGEAFAADPESLMRSRYSAFVLDDRDYLLATWLASERPAGIEAPEPSLKWLGLQVRAVEQSGADAGTVEFVARSKLAGRAHRLHERSRFVREGGRWFYVDGEIDPVSKAAPRG